MLYRIILYLPLLVLTHPVVSQVNDAGLRANVYLNKIVTPNWNIRLKFQGRMNQNISRIYRAYADIGMSCKINKHVRLMYGYVFIEKRSRNDFWDIGHLAYAGLTLKQKIGPFTFSNRILSQIQYSKIFSSENGTIPNIKMRNKTTIKYNKASRYTYYAACELYYKVNGYYKDQMPDQGQFERLRYIAGVFYEINKVNEIELYYLIDNNFNVSNAKTNFVIGIGYAHTFY